ncbi:MAG TPA: hypothetical protein VF432_13390 [Thermoanaerobaculia bacterium]
MILAVLAALTVSLSPPQPKVGDLITVTFPEPVVLDASREYEVVARKGNVVVLRTFEPREFALNGTMGNVRFRNLKVPMASVLRKGDDLAPAPLAPPRPAEITWLQWLAVALAVLLALALVAFLWIRLRRKKPKAEAVPQLTAEERFRAAVLALRADPSRHLRWAALADETRRYLAATRPQLGSELTTTELVPRLDDRQRVVEEILRQGDLEKFSRRGPAEREFDALADRALELAS